MFHRLTKLLDKPGRKKSEQKPPVDAPVMGKEEWQNTPPDRRENHDCQTRRDATGNDSDDRGNQEP